MKFDAIKRWSKYRELKLGFLQNIKTKKPIFKIENIEKIVEKSDLRELSEQYNFFCYYQIK